MTYAIIYEYSQEYSQPKIGKKVKNTQLGPEKQYPYVK